MITLNWKASDGAHTMAINESESSYRYRALMQKESLTLKFSLPEYIEFPVGTQCVYQNTTYTLHTPQNIKKNGERDIEYTLTFGTDVEHLSRYKLRNNEDGRLKWSMTAKPAEFIRQIVLNLNARDGKVWSVGTCVDAPEKTIEFNHTYIFDALQTIAGEFETEWEIDGHCISLRKVEYFKDAPVALSYGRGNGFKPSVGRTSPSNTPPVEILYVQGGDKNIDASKYGGRFLLLPKAQEYVYEGRRYKVSADGLSVQRADKEPLYNNEDSLELQDIYPSRVGTCTSVEVKDKNKHFYDIIDTSIPETLNYNDHIIEGESMTLIFQSGMLAGKEFEVKYKHAERRFEIVPEEFDGIIMPSETFKPEAGKDTYAIFGIMLPDEYICDNVNQSGASWDMFKEACRYLYENEDQKFTFTGELQGIWAKKNWLAVGGKLKVGGYVHFSDNQFAPDGVDIRITGIKDFLYNPYAPTIELSNDTTGTSVSSALKQVSRQEVVIEDNYRNSIRYTRRTFRDAKETMEMLEGAVDGFSESVNPISIQTMAMLVGDESLQFVFTDSKNGNATQFTPQYDPASKTLSCGNIFLKHMTLGIDSMSPHHELSEYKVWSMAAWVSPTLSDGSKKYYLYARCPENTDEVGAFLLSERVIRMREAAGSYHFLVGILNSESNGERSYASLHGFTEVLPARITTDKIVSSDGQNFFDLLGNMMRLGSGSNYLDWNNEEEATLVLSNAKIKNALKVIGEALIAGFKFTDDIITSEVNTEYESNILHPNGMTSQGSVIKPAFYLDGKRGRIMLYSPRAGGAYSLDTSAGATILLDSQRGCVEVDNDNGCAYMSASGVFCNNPRTNALPSSSGYTHYGSIVGLGYTKDVNNTWAFDKEQTMVAGVYGRASNTGSAPAYGGYFANLKAAGLILNLKYVTDSAGTTAITLGELVSHVVGLTNRGVVGQVYLPNDGIEGKVIWVKQLGQGTTRVYPSGGQKISDDISENEYYNCDEGQELKLVFTKYRLNGESVEVWAVSRYKF